MDSDLASDVRRVGRWFWMTFAFGIVFSFPGSPVVIAILGGVLVTAIHRLGSPVGIRPDVRVPLGAGVAVVVLSLVSWAVPAVRDDATSVIVATIGIFVVTLIGIDGYLRALADVASRTEPAVATRIDRDRWMCWVLAAVALAGMILWAVGADRIWVTAEPLARSELSWAGPA